MRTISVGPPAWAMSWPALFVAGVLTPAATSPATSSGFLLAIPVLVVAAGVYRAGWVSLSGSSDGLVIRNYLTTRRVPASEIRGFDVGSFPGGIGGRTVRVVTPGRVIPINVYTMRAPWTLLWSAARLRRIADELTAWADDVRARRDEQALLPDASADPG